MTQTVALVAVLGASHTGEAIGYRVLDLAGVVYSAFTTDHVVESAVAGTYRVENGIVAPAAGGTVIVGTVGADLAEAAIDPAAPTLAEISVRISADHGSGSYQRESGVGILTYVYTVTDSVSGLPLDGVYVWVTVANNASEDPPQASGFTIATGVVTFHLDPGWYYFWKQLAGWDAPTADLLEVS